MSSLTDGVQYAKRFGPKPKSMATTTLLPPMPNLTYRVIAPVATAIGNANAIPEICSASETTTASLQEPPSCVYNGRSDLPSQLRCPLHARQSQTTDWVFGLVYDSALAQVTKNIVTRLSVPSN